MLYKLCSSSFADNPQSEVTSRFINNFEIYRIDMPNERDPGDWSADNRRCILHVMIRACRLKSQMGYGNRYRHILLSASVSQGGVKPAWKLFKRISRWGSGGAD